MKSEKGEKKKKRAQGEFGDGKWCDAKITLINLNKTHNLGKKNPLV